VKEHVIRTGVKGRPWGRDSKKRGGQEEVGRVRSSIHRKNIIEQVLGGDQGSVWATGGRIASAAHNERGMEFAGGLEESHSHEKRKAQANESVQEEL